ncbi:unnamed protein product, partial [Effrenium voratum]
MLASVLGRHGVPSQDPWLHSDPWSAAGNVLAGSEELPGLEQWLSRLRLEAQIVSRKAHGDAIRSWAAEMGAVSLEELAEHWAELSADLGLRPLERRRLERNGLAEAAQVEQAGLADRAEG